MTSPERVPFICFVSGLLNVAHVIAGYVYIFLSLSNMKQDDETPIELELQRVLAGLIVTVIGTCGLVGIIMESVRILILSDIAAITYLVFAILRLGVVLLTGKSL